jgi:hypothetical protein
MAEYTIYLVPQHSSFQPSVEAAAAAESLVRDFWGGEAEFNEVKSNFYKEQTLITTGVAFEEVTCPKCEATISRWDCDDDIEEEVSDFFGEMEKPDQIVTMPCCHAEIRLDELDFGSSAAFARFALESIDADDEFSSEQIKELEAILACRLRQIVEVRG